MKTEEGERSLAISGLRRRLGVLTVKCQAHSLLGRLEVLGPGATAAAGRRWQAAELERCWRREERAHTLAAAVWICQAGLIVQKCFSAIIYSIINVQYRL